MKGRQQLRQALTNATVRSRRRLVKESLEVAEVVARGGKDTGRCHRGAGQEAQLDGVGLRDDADVVNNRVPQLPDDAQGVIPFALVRRLLRVQDEGSASNGSASRRRSRSLISSQSSQVADSHSERPSVSVSK